MTREEAIWWVNHLFEIRKEEYFNKGMMKDAKEVEEAQHIAIYALQEVDEHMISGGGKIRNLPPINQKQITDKLESAEIATSEGEESTMSQPKSKLDCISREQAIEALDRIGSVDTEADREYARDIFDNLPPVTPTERIGEWIIWNEPGNECVYCTKCKHEYDQIDLYIGGSEYPNFCPNCGARMKGGDSERQGKKQYKR